MFEYTFHIDLFDGSRDRKILVFDEQLDDENLSLQMDIILRNNQEASSVTLYSEVEV